MSKTLHNELRKEFQLERLILFSDAVFAIAITLMVIEIKIPEVHGEEVTDQALLHRLREMIPKFIGFLISFLLIGQYWIVHHRMFGYVINFTGKLIWLNIFFLLAVALMPFSTGFYSEYLMTKTIPPVTFLTFNIHPLVCSQFFLSFFSWVDLYFKTVFKWATNNHDSFLIQFYHPGFFFLGSR